ncbi:uncharacterized protein K452DRAFT_283136 [Aplosporella prunicola CBS 121167]|uniref:DUF2406 domain-containing protein n=1 Tax=Aplosporella prunicola CBS 121167 TaxID=1176127 RepID=A0A6A6BUN6_9PEZI|nr:uncharacterized protein K452DRAFT_283136 [Aplosporella prunicola CBS 121167]KAF2146934.1 hypothetical protein K452DRAFT_283136 [Aplosporella prunicola CBS 121167]
MEHRSHQRPRSKSGFSFKSERSEKSEKSEKITRPKIKDLHETSAEKHKHHLSSTSKANPLAAMEEAQPIAQQFEKATLGSLRAIQHKDANGNLITEPDLTNPTRPRWERPLDTIRSFEAAIDGGHKRTPMPKSESTPQFSGYTSRRSSYYGGNDQSDRFSNGGYYARGRDSYNDTYGAAPVAGPTRNRYGQRIQADITVPRPVQGQGQGPYPSQYYQHSRDTVNTGASNSSGEPWGNSTDPSSENSSIERTTPNPKPDLNEQYGFNGFGGDPIAEEYDYANRGYAPPVNGYRNGGYPQQDYSSPPQPPPHAARPNGNMIKLGDGPPPQPISGATNGAAAAPRRPQVQTADSDKRKSWFKRKFSKD